MREQGLKDASLLRAVWRFTKTRILVSCFVFLFCLIFGFIGPTCIVKGLVAFAENPPREDDSIDYGYGLILVLSILVVDTHLKDITKFFRSNSRASCRTAARGRSAIEQGFEFVARSLHSSSSVSSEARH